MQNVNWGSFRIALYSIVGGIVAALGAWGIIAESQVDSITQAVTAVLGALIAILAAANVNKKGKETTLGTAYVNVEPRLVMPSSSGSLPVYNGPSSTPDEYEGQHRLDG